MQAVRAGTSGPHRHALAAGRSFARTDRHNPVLPQAVNALTRQLAGSVATTASTTSATQQFLATIAVAFSFKVL